MFSGASRSDGLVASTFLTNLFLALFVNLFPFALSNFLLIFYTQNNEIILKGPYKVVIKNYLSLAAILPCPSFKCLIFGSMY